MPIFDDDSDTDGAAVRQHLLRLEAAMLCGLLNLDWPPREWKGCLAEQLERDDLPPMPTFTAAQLSMPFGAGVRALAAGESFAFNRGELASDPHPLRYAGGPYDRLVLTEDDEIEESR
jgi:hypothetical protein